MKKIVYNILFLSFIISGLSGCLKGDTPNIDPNAGTIVTLEYLKGGGGTVIGSDLTYFSGAALLYPATDEADTATFSVILGGGASINKDVAMTIGVDANALKDNFANDSITYEVMPDSLYKIVNTTQTIKAGDKYAVFQVIFYPSKIDPTQNYMLPLTVTDAAGYTVSTNFGHVYFHTIGNPIAGLYNTVGTRYNYTGSSNWSGIGTYPTPVSTINTSGSKLASPSSTTVITLPYANLGGGSSPYLYVITYDAATQTISTSGNFLKSVSNFTVHTQTITFDANGKATMHIVTTYNNKADGSGDDRIIDETFTQQ